MIKAAVQIAANPKIFCLLYGNEFGLDILKELSVNNNSIYLGH